MPDVLPPGPVFAILLVMGVSGSGKTTVASALAAQLGWPFLEGDALHPPANIAKMAGGRPLTDEDRAPWLTRIAADIHSWSAARQSGIVTCSALRRAYRRILLDGIPEARIVYLTGSRELLQSRMKQRKGHFMPSVLLDSQIATLEEPAEDEHPIIIDVAEPLPAILHDIEAELAKGSGTCRGSPLRFGGTGA